MFGVEPEPYVDLGSVFFTFFIIERYDCHSPGGGTAAALRAMAFYAIYDHSPGGDTAPALVEFALYECSCFYY